jgi:hypothetical protein
MATAAAAAHRQPCRFALKMSDFPLMKSAKMPYSRGFPAYLRIKVRSATSVGLRLKSTA